MIIDKKSHLPMVQILQGKPRKKWIDALRALAILLVVYGHHAPTLTFSAFFNPLKMPLFFALSAYLFYIKPGGDKAFFRKTLHSLVIPWLFLGIIPLLFGIPFRGLRHIIHSVIDVIIGEQLWFMPCFIIAQIIYYYNLKYTQKHHLLTVVFMLTLSVIGYFMRINHIGDMFMFNEALFVQFYFLIGFLYKEYESSIIKYRKLIGIAFILLYVVIVLTFFPGSSMDVHNARLSNPAVCIIVTPLGLFGLFMLSSLIMKYPKWLLAVGRNSLVIYMLDKYIGIPIGFFYHFNDRIYFITFLAALIYLAYSSVVSITIAKVLNKYIPWATGNRG